MEVAAERFLGIGIYTVPEASRYTKVCSTRIRRWVKGYSFPYKGETHESPPLWKHELPIVDDQLSLSFRDLIEVMFIDAFLRHRISWKEIREAAVAAAKDVNSSHPFSTLKFKTDGKRIIREYAEELGRKRLLELVRGQYTMETIVGPHLYGGVEFAGSGGAVRWYPMTGKQIVLNPEIQFGKPVVLPSAIPTEILANAHRAQRSVERVARWFDVTTREVSAALDYERDLSKKAA